MNNRKADKIALALVIVLPVIAAVMGIIAILSVAADRVYAAERPPHYGPYSATLIKVYDGDTVNLLVYPWPGDQKRISVRLDGIDTPELRPRKPAGTDPTIWESLKQCEKSAAISAKLKVERLLATGEAITLQTIYPNRTKFYGRMVGRITVGGKDLSEALLAGGYARPYSGGKRQPWCAK